ncbi:MAG: PhzF family phenazine biosynthesis protein, partial [Bdellovibrionales bacterium]
NKYHLRWFTPTTEVDLCGHATLASAFVLFNELDYKTDKIHFTCLSGNLFVTKNKHGYMMDFPVWDYAETTVSLEVTDALGARPSALFKGNKWIALFDDETTVRNMTPDLEKVKNIKDCNGILSTAAAKDTDFVSRNFASQRGIPEDPVTGSAHCALTPFWAERLDKTKLTAYQASQRGGHLLCELKNDRVEITGQACLYMKGKIYL